MIMIGYDDERQSYYFVVEDDDETNDIYCVRSNLEKKFIGLLTLCLGII